EMDQEAAGLMAANRIEETRYRRHADDFRIGEGDEQFAESLGAPQRTGTDISLGHDRSIDQGDVASVVDGDDEALVGGVSDMRRNATADGKADGQSGDGRLTMFGECVVGAGRN